MAADSSQTAEQQFLDLQAGTVDLVPADDLLTKLKSGRELIVKLGVDPTSPDLHLGHAVPLRKMRQFQDLGHLGVLVIGSGTAKVGDPSGRNSTRPVLSDKEIAKNAQTYVEQAYKVLDPKRTKVVYNGDWILSLDFKQLLELLSTFSVARILERDDFKKRFSAQQSISVHEFIYPMLQALDSVEIKADVELGGQDQIFNLLAGRDLMRAHHMEPQVALTMPLLVGTDGTKKMSKSYGNYIGLTDDPNDMYGKVMSIPDELLSSYYTLTSSFSRTHNEDVARQLKDGTANPYELKHALAKDIVTTYHGEEAAEKAAVAFKAVFSGHERPEAPSIALTLTPNDEGLIYLPALLVAAHLAQSNGEARRAIDGGAIKINDKPLAVHTYNVSPQLVEKAFIQVGKRKAVQLI